MYFDIAPKVRKEDLFGMEYLVGSLIDYVKDKRIRMIVLKGLRRTGKTSLLNVSLQESGVDYLKIDVRESPYSDKKEFMLHLIERSREKLGESLFKRILGYISGIKISYKELETTINLDFSEKKFFSFFRRLNDQLKRKNTFMVIAFDEAQLLKGINFDYFLASIFDNYPNIKVILTGSEIGLLDEFLGKSDADSPLFGRAMIEIKTEKLRNEQIAEFLKAGFIQIKKEISLDQLREVIEHFDGIIGWATNYGWLRYTNISHHEALSKTIEEGIKLTRKELEKFLEKRNKAVYLKLLNYIAKGNNRWSLLKNRFIQGGRRISDRQLNLYLNELIEYSFVEKVNQIYFIADPLLLKAVS